MAQPATPMRPRRESTPSIPPKLVPAADLVKRLQELHESIARRAYESFESKGRTCGRDLEDWLQAESEFLHPVHVDVADSDDGLTIRAEVPASFRAENLMVGVEARRLTIAGKREAEEERRNEKTIYRESCSDQILRVIDLPVDVVAGKATATLRDGVLELKMPKAAPAKKIASYGLIFDWTRGEGGPSRSSVLGRFRATTSRRAAARSSSVRMKPGRTPANSALARWSGRLGLGYQGAAFKIDGEAHASECEGLILAEKNALNSAHTVLV